MKSPYARRKSAHVMVSLLAIFTFVAVAVVVSAIYFPSPQMHPSTQETRGSSYSLSSSSLIMESGYTYKYCTSTNEIQGASVNTIFSNGTQRHFSLCTYSVPSPPVGTYEKPGNGTLIDINTGKIIFAENNASDLTVILSWGTNTNCAKTLMLPCPSSLYSQLVRLPNLSSNANSSSNDTIQYVVKFDNQSFTLEFSGYSPGIVSSSTPAAVTGT